QIVSDFTLIITNPGYRPVFKVIKVHRPLKKLELGNIDVVNLTKVLKVVVVMPSPVTIKEDTVEYKADGYKVRENSVVEDLLKRLPGVKVDKDGNIKAQGKIVTRVKVNGKDFFGGDPKTASRELPANIVDKIQVIDDYGDQATVSGIKDGDPDKVINLQLKKDKNTGYFGRVSAGGGDKGRYIGSLNANYFDNNRQLSIFSNSNNTSQSQFSFNGLAGSGISSKLAQFKGNDQTVFQNGNTGSDGTTTSNSAGINYKDQWGKKITVYGSYNYGNRENQGYRFMSQENIFSAGSYLNNQDNRYINKGNTHRFYFNLECNIDSLNYIKVSPGLSYGINDNYVYSIFDFSDSTGKTSEGNNEIVTGTHTPNMFANVLYNHRFHKRGRNFSIALNIGSSQNDLTQDTKNNTVFYVAPAGISNRYLYSNQHNTNYNNGIRFTYSEPLSAYRSLDITFNHSFSHARNNKETFEVDSSSGLKTINPFLSNDYKNDYSTNRGNITIRTNQKKYNYTLGISIQPVDLKGFSLSKDSSYKAVSRINIFPVARFAYNFSKGRSLTINYRGDAQQPGYTQLQDVVDLSNPQYQLKGNPNLKPALSHNLNMFFNDFNLANGRSVFTGMNFNAIQNQVVNNIIQLGNSGTQLSIPENVNGYYNANIYYNYSRPYQERKYVISLNGSLNYNHNINLIDSFRTTGENYIASQGINFEFNHREWLSFNAGADYNLNSVRYHTGKLDLLSLQNQEYSSWMFSSTLQLDLPENFVLKYEFNYSINAGLTEAITADIAVLNASIEKQFLKKQNGSIKLEAFDLFNQNSGINRIITANSIIDTRSNRLTRYFMLSFTYRLQKFAGQLSQTKAKEQKLMQATQMNN
ncbi:MAG: outer membrane beta-barrel protein, partial [Ginsengibacter sp.]